MAFELKTALRICRREGINLNVYYRWSKEFLEAGKQRLSGDIKRKVISDEVTQLRKENNQLEHALADVVCCRPEITRIACNLGIE